jgi:hypothetical protein
VRLSLPCVSVRLYHRVRLCLRPWVVRPFVPLVLAPSVFAPSVCVPLDGAVVTPGVCQAVCTVVVLGSVRLCPSVCEPLEGVLVA